MTSHRDNSNEEKNFGEFRRKVKSAEVLSASMEHLLLSLGFTGRVSVVMQNGTRAQVGLRRRLLPPAAWWGQRRRERAQTVEAEEAGGEQKLSHAAMGMLLISNSIKTK